MVPISRLETLSYNAEVLSELSNRSRLAADCSYLRLRWCSGVNAKVADFLERAGWSAGQVFFATLVAGGSATTVVGLPWKYALILAGGAALTSLVLTAVQYLTKQTDLHFWPDLLVRLAKTFLGSLAGSFAAAHPFDILTFSWTTALNVAAIATLTALGKGLLAGGSKDATTPPTAGADPPVGRNPSTLPTATYHAAIAGGT